MHSVALQASSCTQSITVCVYVMERATDKGMGTCKQCATPGDVTGESQLLSITPKLLQSIVYCSNNAWSHQMHGHVAVIWCKRLVVLVCVCACSAQQGWSSEMCMMKVEAGARIKGRNMVIRGTLCASQTGVSYV